MPNLPALSGLGELMPGSLERQTSREITRGRALSQVVSAQDIAKLEAIAQVSEAALLATSHISAVEALLISRTPHAEARLRHIADAGCTGMATVVLRVGSRIS
jgi:hypothetical protein